MFSSRRKWDRVAKQLASAGLFLVHIVTSDWEPTLRLPTVPTQSHNSLYGRSVAMVSMRRACPFTNVTLPVSSLWHSVDLHSPGDERGSEAPHSENTWAELHFCQWVGVDGEVNIDLSNTVRMWNDGQRTMGIEEVSLGEPWTHVKQRQPFTIYQKILLFDMSRTGKIQRDRK